MKNEKHFKHGDAFIHSMEVLIERYKKAIELEISKWDYEKRNKMSCLLCNPIGIENNQHNSYDIDEDGDTVYTYFDDKCKNLGCPWIVILGMTCSEFDTGTLNDVYNTNNPIIMKRRIRQLNNWIKIYQKHMEKLNEIPSIWEVK